MDATTRGAVTGAAIGAALAIGVPFLLLAAATVGYKGGGANIGLGLLFLAMPVYLPVLMLLGWKLGKKMSCK